MTEEDQRQQESSCSREVITAEKEIGQRTAIAERSPYQSSLTVQGIQDS